MLIFKWWFQFHAFAMLWKFAGAVGKVPEVDLPSSENASLSTNTDIQDRQKVAKKQNAIAYANLTIALQSPSLIGTLMRAQTPDWPSRLARMVVKQLYDKFEPQEHMSLINMNQLKQ